MKQFVTKILVFLQTAPRPNLTITICTKISSPLQILVPYILNIFCLHWCSKDWQKRKICSYILIFSGHTMNTESYLDRYGFVDHFYNNNIITDKPTWCWLSAIPNCLRFSILYMRKVRPTVSYWTSVRHLTRFPSSPTNKLKLRYCGSGIQLIQWIASIFAGCLWLLIYFY